MEIRIKGTIDALWKNVLLVWGFGQVGPIVCRQKFMEICEILLEQTSVLREAPSLMELYRFRPPYDVRGQAFSLDSPAISVPEGLRKQFKDARKCRRIAMLLLEQDMKP